MFVSCCRRLFIVLDWHRFCIFYCLNFSVESIFGRVSKRIFFVFTLSKSEGVFGMWRSPHFSTFVVSPFQIPLQNASSEPPTHPPPKHTHHSFATSRNPPPPPLRSPRPAPPPLQPSHWFLCTIGPEASKQSSRAV